MSIFFASAKFKKYWLTQMCLNQTSGAKMEFFVYETGETISAKQRPLIIITSNNEKELPDAFLRRCFFHYIQFHDRETMQEIVNVHYPNLQQQLANEALEIFFISQWF